MDETAPTSDTPIPSTGAIESSPTPAPTAAPSTSTPSTGSLSLTPQASDTGTITSDALTPSTAFNLTAPTPSTAVDGALGMIGSNNDAYTAQLAAQADQFGQNDQDALSRYLTAVTDTPGQAQLTEQEYGNTVDPAQANLNNINQQILAEQNGLNQQLNALQTTNPNGLSADAISDEVSRIKTASLNRQADLSVIQAAAQNQYDNAKLIADRAVAAQTEQNQNQLTALQTNYENNKDLFTTAEQNAFTSMMADKQNDLDIQKSAATAYYQYLITYGTPPPGMSSPSDVTGYQGGATNGPNTPAGNTSGTVVGGVDFGDVPGVGAYATDVNSEVTGVTRMFNGIQGSDAQSIQTYINNNAPNSPITGQMIVAAANQAGIDPRILAATVGNESNFGTVGAGAKTMNPGNVGNTDDGSTQPMSSWQAGLIAAAQQLARRKVTVAGPNQPGTVSSGMTTDNTPASVPTVLQPYYSTSYSGQGWVNLSSLSGPQQTAYARIAESAGLKPILDSDTASKLQAIGASKSNLNDILQTFMSEQSGGGLAPVNGVINGAKGFFGDAGIKSYNSFRTAVINNVQALAGGSGSGLRINQAEIDAAMNNDLPVLTGTDADTLSSAQRKIMNLNSQLQIWEQQIMGSGNTPSTQPTLDYPKDGYVRMQGAQGTYDVPEAHVKTFAQQGYNAVF